MSAKAQNRKPKACSVVIVGGTSSDERPEGWADGIGEFICDLFGVEDHRQEVPAPH